MDRRILRAFTHVRPKRHAGNGALSDSKRQETV
jgi:hypothetical protein